MPEKKTPLENFADEMENELGDWEQKEATDLVVVSDVRNLLRTLINAARGLK